MENEKMKKKEKERKNRASAKASAVTSLYVIKSQDPMSQLAAGVN